MLQMARTRSHCGRLGCQCPQVDRSRKHFGHSTYTIQFCSRQRPIPKQRQRKGQTWWNIDIALGLLNAFSHLPLLKTLDDSKLRFEEGINSPATCEYFESLGSSAMLRSYFLPSSVTFGGLRALATSHRPLHNILCRSPRAEALQGLDVWDAWSFFKLLDLDKGNSTAFFNSPNSDLSFAKHAIFSGPRETNDFTWLFNSMS